MPMTICSCCDVTPSAWAVLPVAPVMRAAPVLPADTAAAAADEDPEAELEPEPVAVEAEPSARDAAEAAAETAPALGFPPLADDLTDGGGAAGVCLAPEPMEACINGLTTLADEPGAPGTCSVLWCCCCCCCC